MINGIRFENVEFEGEVLLQVPDSVSYRMAAFVLEDPAKGKDRALSLLASVLGHGFDPFKIEDMITPQKVIFNEPATIVYWRDGAKTVVTCDPRDTYNKESGLALCYMKKVLGNKGNYNKVLRETIKKAQRQGGNKP